MSFLSRLNPWSRKNSTLDLWRDIYGGRETGTGINITARNALEVATALRCAQVIADGISTVPLRLHKKNTATGERGAASDHPLYDLLAVAPNEWQDSLQFRETLAFHLVLCGNAYCFINRVGGQIVELIPIEPARVTVKQNADYSLAYTVTALDGKSLVLPPEAIWHIRGPSWNSWMGMEPVYLAREALGLSLALEKSHSGLHKNGLQTTGVYSFEGVLDAENYKRLRGYMAQHHAGTANAGTPMILDRAGKWLQQSMSGVDAEHLATRRHQIEEVCRFFGVLPIMVGFSDKTATYASAEQMFLAHAVHTIRPWHRRLEASVKKNLLTPAERAEGLYPKFIDTELLRGATKDRAEYYSKALGTGGSPAWLTQNEVREFEELDPKEGGDELPKITNAPAAVPPAITAEVKV